MNNESKILKLDNFKYFKDPINELLYINFTPEEIVDLIETSIDNEDWLRIAKCITWIQNNPSSLYYDPLCFILEHHLNDFHPEEVIDAISEVVEVMEPDDKLIYVTKTIGKVAIIDYDGDPSYHINIKCLHILHWLAGFDGDVGLVAKKELINASNSSILDVSKEAHECLEDF